MLWFYKENILEKIVEKILVSDRVLDGKVYMVFTEDCFYFEMQPNLGRFLNDKFVTDSFKEQFESKWMYWKDEKVYRSRKTFARYQNGNWDDKIELFFTGRYGTSDNIYEYIIFNYGRLSWNIGDSNSFCSNCGKKQDSSVDKFCVNCGNKINSSYGQSFYMKDFLIPPLSSIEEVISKLDLATYRNSSIYIAMDDDISFKISVDLSPSNVVKIIENLRILDEKYYNKYLIKTKTPTIFPQPILGPKNQTIGFKIYLSEKYPSDIYLDKVDGTKLIERQFGKEFSKIENGYEFDDEHRLINYEVKDYPVSKGDIIYIRARALDKEISDPLKIEIDKYLGKLK